MFANRRNYRVISVKKQEFIYIENTSNTAKIGTVNLVVEHVGVVTVLIFAVFNMRVYNTCI